MTIQQLKTIQHELSQYHAPHDIALERAINSRLDRSLLTYVDTMETMKNFLARKDYIKLVKRINKDLSCR